MNYSIIRGIMTLQHDLNTISYYLYDTSDPNKILGGKSFWYNSALKNEINQPVNIDEQLSKFIMKELDDNKDIHEWYINEDCNLNEFLRLLSGSIHFSLEEYIKLNQNCTYIKIRNHNDRIRSIQNKQAKKDEMLARHLFERLDQHVSKEQSDEEYEIQIEDKTYLKFYQKPIDYEIEARLQIEINRLKSESDKESDGDKEQSNKNKDQSEENNDQSKELKEKINDIRKKLTAEKDYLQKMQDRDETFTYHTFLFPFRLRANEALQNKKDQANYFSEYSTKKFIHEIMKDHSNWIEDVIYGGNIKNLSDFKDDSDNIEEKMYRMRSRYISHYKRLQYFNTAPQKAVYGMMNSSEDKDNNVLTQYVFRHQKKKCKMELTVGVPISILDQTIVRYYKLFVNDIRLKVYNTDIAIMIFEIENKLYHDIKDLLNINAFVRRVAVPNLSIEARIMSAYWEIKIFDEENGPKVFMDDIWKSFEKLLMLPEPNEDIKEKYKTYCECVDKISYTKIIDPIKQLLMDGSKFFKNYPHERITSHKTYFQQALHKTLFIESIIDDRMFVCCYSEDDNLMEKICKIHSEGSVEGILELKDDESKRKSIVQNIKFDSPSEQYGYQANYKIAKDLYEFIFVDENGSTCQDMFMIQDLLQKSLYTRWIDWGTVQAITHHSLMMLTTQTAPDYLLENHLELYVEMACMVLAQRASILQFQLFASELTNGLEKDERGLNQKRINYLLNLQERYITFQNQLLFFEVSPEEQAVELYKMLNEAMYIDEEKACLADQLESLYEATNVNQDSRFNFWATIFAIITLILAGITFIYDTRTNLTLDPNMIKQDNSIHGFITYIESYPTFAIFVVVAVIISIVFVLYIFNKKFEFSQLKKWKK